MGFVDEFDRDCTKYSVQLPVGRRPDKTAWTKKTTCFIFDIFLENVYCFWRQKYERENPQAKNLPYRFRQNFMLNFARKLLKRKVPKTLSAQEQEEYRQTPPAKRRRHQCYQCPHFKKGGVRSYSSCHLCGNFICKAHSVQVCYPCATSVNNENPELDQARLSE